MVDPVFKFETYLIEKNANGQYTFPLQGLVLTGEDCSQICGIIRSKLFGLFKDICKCNEIEYKIYLENQKQLNILKPLKDEIDLTKDNTLYLAISSNNMKEAFWELEDRKIQEAKKESEIKQKEKEALWELEEQKRKEAKKESEIKKKESDIKKKESENKKAAENAEKKDFEKALLIELSIDLKEEINFSSVIGDLEKIVNSSQLQIPQAYNFSANELSELEILRKAFDIMQKNHYIVNEAGNHIFASDILGIALNFVKPEQVKIQNEYTIAPMLKFEKNYGAGIERGVDCVVFKQVPANIICLTKMKTSLMDLKICLMQNADQMRAFCLCKGKNKIAGIATNGIKWIFTTYEVMDSGRGQFLVSKAVDVLTEKDFGYYEIMESTYVRFFGSLISFITENMNPIE